MASADIGTMSSLSHAMMQSVLNALETVSEHLSGSHVFADATVCECLHWGVSAEQLFDKMKVAGFSVIPEDSNLGQKKKTWLGYDMYNVLQPQSVKTASLPEKVVFLIAWNLDYQNLRRDHYDLQEMNAVALRILETVRRTMEIYRDFFEFKKVFLGLAWPKQIFESIIQEDFLGFLTSGIRDIVDRIQESSQSSLKQSVDSSKVIQDEKSASTRATNTANVWSSLFSADLAHLEEKSQFSTQAVSSNGENIVVNHVPLYFSPILPHLFLVPSLSMFPANNTEDYMELSAVYIASILDEMNMTPEIYSVGKASASRIADLLLKENGKCFSNSSLASGATSGLLLRGKGIHHKSQRSESANFISVVFINRNSDLLSVMGHENHILDRAYSVLKKASDELSEADHVNSSMYDVVSDSLSHYCFLSDPCESDHFFSGGSLSHPGDRESLSFLDALNMSNDRKSTRLIQKYLSLIQTGSLTSNLSSSVISDHCSRLEESMHSLLSQNAISLIFEYSGILEICGVALEGVRRTPSWEEVANFEKLLRLSHSNPGIYGIEETSLLTQLTALIRSHSPARVDLITALSLTIYTIALQASTSIEQRQHRNSVHSDVTTSHGATNFLHADESQFVESMIRSFGIELVRFLSRDIRESDELKHDVIELRSAELLRAFLDATRKIVRESITSGELNTLKLDKGCNVPFVKKLLDEIFDPNSSLSDVCVHGTAGSGSVASSIAASSASAISSVVGGVGSLFSRLGLQARQRPNRRNYILLYFVGDVTWLEVREIISAIEIKNGQANHQIQILIGSSNFATSRNILHRIISQTPS